MNASPNPLASLLLGRDAAGVEIGSRRQTMSNDARFVANGPQYLTLGSSTGS